MIIFKIRNCCGDSVEILASFSDFRVGFDFNSLYLLQCPYKMLYQGRGSQIDVMKK